ncbi:MAG: hypothetical protein ING19_07350 [Azospirillum sp.]|nr:hypothetical protein [Azospirillum sp.]
MTNFLPADLGVLELGALLDAAAAVDASKWLPGSAGALAHPDWRLHASGEVADLGRLLDEIAARARAEGTIRSDQRDRAIAVIERAKEALPEARAFFMRPEVREGLQRLKARALMQARAERRKEERERLAVQRVELSAHADDVAELRRIADEMLRKRGIEPISPRPRGRPRKTLPPTNSSSSPAPVPATLAAGQDRDPFGPYFTPRKHP